MSPSNKSIYQVKSKALHGPLLREFPVLQKMTPGGAEASTGRRPALPYRNGKSLLSS